MTELATGTEVVRIKGAKYQIGVGGTVVEVGVSGERLRVLWHTNLRCGTKPKRTWVHRSVVRLAT